MGVHVRSARPRATGGNAVRRTRGATLKRRTNAPDDVVEFLALGLLGPRRHLLPLLHHARTPRHLRRSSPAEGRVTGVPLSWLRRGTMSVFTLFSLRRKAPAACASLPAEKWRAKCGSICWMRDGLTDSTRPVASQILRCSSNDEKEPCKIWITDLSDHTFRSHAEKSLLVAIVFSVFISANYLFSSC